MGEENKVILHGNWASPFAKRVELALKVKGIPFEYVDEDMRNKTPLLLKYNPIHKKVPVLVHNGKPICESLVILEYIDETWPNIGPQFLPKDPYQRSQVRFWIAYIQQLFDSIGKLFTVDEEAQKKSVEEVHEKLKILENGMKELYPDGSSDINSENLGMLDIMMVASLGSFKAFEEVFPVKILDPERNPLTLSRVEALIMLPVVKETAIPHDKLVGLLQILKQTGI